MYHRNITWSQKKAFKSVQKPKGRETTKTKKIILKNKFMILQCLILKRKSQDSSGKKVVIKAMKLFLNMVKTPYVRKKASREYSGQKVIIKTKQQRLRYWYEINQWIVMSFIVMLLIFSFFFFFFCHYRYIFLVLLIKKCWIFC